MNSYCLSGDLLVLQEDGLDAVDSMGAALPYRQVKNRWVRRSCSQGTEGDRSKEQLIILVI
jgi:hypothetical protein